MRLDRCFVIACVMLSHACDSKSSSVSTGSGSNSAVVERARDAALAGSYYYDLVRRINVPVVIAGTEPLPERALTVSVTATMVSVDGTALDPIENGAFPPHAVSGPNHIPKKLSDRLGELDAEALANDKPILTVYFAIDQSLPSALVVQLLRATSSTPDRYVLVVRTANGVAAGLPFREAGRDDAIATENTDGEKIEVPVSRQQSIAALAERISHQRTAPGQPGERNEAGRELEAIVAENSQSLNRCFNESLERDGPTRGHEMVVTVVVDDQQRVNFVDVQPADPNRPIPKRLVECLQTAIDKWTMRGVPKGTYDFPLQMRAE